MQSHRKTRAKLIKGQRDKEAFCDVKMFVRNRIKEQTSLSLTLIHDSSFCIVSTLFLTEQCKARLTALFWVRWILFRSSLDPGSDSF